LHYCHHPRASSLLSQGICRGAKKKYCHHPVYETLIYQQFYKNIVTTFCHHPEGLEDKNLLPEKKVETQIKNYLISLNAYFIKTIGGSVAAGTPDIIACVNGRFIGIEVRRPTGGRVSELQKNHIKRINEAGGIAFVASSKDEVINHLSEFNII